jgi:nicotinamidase-related amidase/type 1 glutamine amidotransferase
MISLRTFLAALLACCAVQLSGVNAQPLELHMRYQEETSSGSARYHRLERETQWDPAQTALIVCDMWDLHHCHQAVLRGKELTPALERVLANARARGVTIIHAPSGCVDTYASHPARQRTLATPISKNVPDGMTQWCYKIPQEEAGVYPIDQSAGGEDDELQEHADWAAELTKLGRDPKAPWKSQCDGLTIDPARDFISDRGDEVWSILEAKGIKHVILTGVHTNMCVLGRPFGLRRMVQAGVSTVLMSDMTDTMYDPRCSPFVSHFTGTDLIVDHIERHVCPTITSDQLLGGEPFRFAKDTRPTVAILMAENEYQTHETLPPWSVKWLGPAYRIRWLFSSDTQSDLIPGIEAIQDADLLLVSARRRTLRTDHLQAIRDFVASGKPMLGLRTASHAFSLRTGAAPTGTSVWPEFDATVWGGQYTNHYGNQLYPQITRAEPATTHPILADWGVDPLESKGSLYMVSPLLSGATPLLVGNIEGQKTEPVAWTFHRPDGGYSFYTSLGHRDDFSDARFQTLLRNATSWLLNQNSSHSK